MKKVFKVGGLYGAAIPSSAIKTDPWKLTGRTITYSDHHLMKKDDLILLLFFGPMDDAGIFIFLFEEKILWQAMKLKDFNKCWKFVQ